MTLLDDLARHVVTLVPGWDYATDRALLPGKTPLVVVSMPSSPDAVVLFTTYPGGPEPDSRNGWEYPRLQVRVRARNPLQALDLDRQAYDVLQGLAAELPGGTWLLSDCYALQSEAAPMGQDANGRHDFTRNYQLAVSPA